MHSVLSLAHTYMQEEQVRSRQHHGVRRDDTYVLVR